MDAMRTASKESIKTRQEHKQSMRKPIARSISATGGNGRFALFRCCARTDAGRNQIGKEKKKQKKKDKKEKKRIAQEISESGL
mgnify:CR=1 FL=1